MTPTEIVESIGELIEEVKLVHGKNYVRIPTASINDETRELFESLGFTLELEEDVDLGNVTKDLYRISK